MGSGARPSRRLAARGLDRARAAAPPQMGGERVGDPFAHADVLLERRQLDGAMQSARDPGAELQEATIHSWHGRILPCGSPRGRRRARGPRPDPRRRAQWRRGWETVPAPGVFIFTCPARGEIYSLSLLAASRCTWAG